jgi:uncharacterized membrane protein YvlD (DUF360 family)
MSDLIMPESGNSLSQARGRGFWPRSALGWIAIVLALVALASWVVFPVLTMAYRERYPVVDTWVMPAIATTLVDAAAILSLVTVWLRRERSVLNILTLVVTMLAGLFFTFMVVGEAIGSA